MPVGRLTIFPHYGCFPRQALVRHRARSESAVGAVLVVVGCGVASLDEEEVAGRWSEHLLDERFVIARTDASAAGCWVVSGLPTA